MWFSYARIKRYYYSLINSMEINILSVLTCGIIAMVLGYVWYGPLFGKKWMEIIGATALDEEKRKEMEKKAGPLYVIQFLLALSQVYILAHFVKAWEDGGGIGTAVWIWGGFVVPTVAASSMWNNDSNEVKLARFLIQSGYYLVLFVIFGYILGTWS
jgi:hypothetical protein